MASAPKAKPSVEECEFSESPNAKIAIDGSGDRIITAPGQVLELEELVLDGRTVRTWKNVSAGQDPYPGSQDQ